MAEWFFEGVLEAGSQERSGAGGGDVHDVFAADAEFAGDVDAGLVGEGHVRQETGVAALNEIGMFVDVEPNAVAETM